MDADINSIAYYFHTSSEEIIERREHANNNYYTMHACAADRYPNDDEVLAAKGTATSLESALGEENLLRILYANSAQSQSRRERGDVLAKAEDAPLRVR